MAARNARFSLIAATLVAVVGSATPALALDNDPDLHRLCVGFNPEFDPRSERACGNAPKPDQSAFRDLSREYGMALAPSLLSPAETLGINGFQFNAQISITTINADKAYWSRGVEDQDAPAALVATRLDARKGLPYSFEIGMSGTYLMESELWMLGGMVKFSPNEAVDALPVDLAVRGTFGRLVGSPQLELTTAGLDLVVSRGFGVGGVVNIAPYMAYSPVFLFARSGVIDVTPAVNDGAPRPSEVSQASIENSFIVFDEEQQTIHRFVIGARFVLGAFNFTPEVALTQGLQSYNINIGLDF
ncbi:MAG: hypothetical protein KC620_21620 [Myxococcales bacterium]|nr:hypothetical protein [Myxococcales bacterium]